MTIGDLFENKGYDKKKIIDNAYHDINYLIKNQKIEQIEATKPKKYRCYCGSCKLIECMIGSH